MYVELLKNEIISSYLYIYKPPKNKTKKAEESINAQPQPQAPAAKPPPKKPIYSMKKGQIVRVDKEKYLNSVNVLDLRSFETGEYALVAWVGIPTAPAWLPNDRLIMAVMSVSNINGDGVATD
ncbi:hypothetical protein V6N11_031685 [Hibiscus sabdariffa]|uniref:Uncharacterized protein n=1 Tax=Hibiscus sabdariffa TaxID=183260 RepID=A0ABR2SYE4_9ROSI